MNQFMIMGILNGYGATLAMMFGPSSVKNISDQAKAGTVMVFSLTLGLTVGAYISYIIGNVIL